MNNQNLDQRISVSYIIFYLLTTEKRLVKYCMDNISFQCFGKCQTMQEKSSESVLEHLFATSEWVLLVWKKTAPPPQMTALSRDQERVVAAIDRNFVPDDLFPTKFEMFLFSLKIILQKSAASSSSSYLSILRYFPIFII